MTDIERIDSLAPEEAKAALKLIVIRAGTSGTSIGNWAVKQVIDAREASAGAAKIGDA